MTPVELIVLLAKCNDDAIVCSDALETNAVAEVVEIIFDDVNGHHDYVYICDDADYVIDSYQTDLENNYISNLVVNKIKK